MKVVRKEEPTSASDQGRVSGEVGNSISLRNRDLS
jgi:hypothetical protein